MEWMDERFYKSERELYKEWYQARQKKKRKDKKELRRRMETAKKDRHCMYYMGTVPCKCERCDEEDYFSCLKKGDYLQPSEEVIDALTQSGHVTMEEWKKEPASACEICIEKSLICHVMDCEKCVEDKSSDSFQPGCSDCKNYGMYVSTWRCIVHCPECDWPRVCWRHDPPYDETAKVFEKMLKDSIVMTRSDWENGEGACELCDGGSDYFRLKGSREVYVRPRRCGVHCAECKWPNYCTRHLPPSQTWMQWSGWMDVDDDDEMDADDETSNDTEPLLKPATFVYPPQEEK